VTVHRICIAAANLSLPENRQAGAAGLSKRGQCG